MTVEIRLNGKNYITDQEIFEIFQSIMPGAVANNDFSAAQVVMSLGMASGRIVEVQK